MSDATTLRTGRLVLRAPAERDIEAIFRACQDPDIQRYTLVPVPYRRTDAREFVRVTAPAPTSSTWTIETSAGGFVGSVGIVFRGDGRGSVGYWCAPDQRRRGYLGEAVAAVIDHAFADPSIGGLGLDELTWSALLDNAASARLAARSGFRYTGAGVIEVAGHADEVHKARLGVADPRTPQDWPATVVGSVSTAGS